MAKFSYKAKNSEGKVVTGILEAPDSRSVSITLRNEGFFVIDIKANFSNSLLAPLLSPFQGKVGMSDITNFTRQLAVMISSGLTITEALTSLQNQSTNPKLEKLLADLRISVESGLSFSKALSVHKETFPDIYVAVVNSGETSGLLDNMLLRLADNLEKDREFRGKLKTAFIYPIIILIGVVIVIAIMMLFVIPQLSTLYEQLSIDLPLPTKIIVAISNFFVVFWWLAVLIAVGAFLAFSNWRKTKSGKEAFDVILIKIPGWGQLQKDSTVAELTRSLGLLIGSGTPIIDSLNSVANATENTLYADAIRRISRKVEKGLSLASACAQEKILPPLIAQMARVGEETGKLDDLMFKVSNYFENEADNRIKNLTTVLEPIILAVLGIVVGFLMISIILPIYNLTSAI